MSVRMEPITPGPSMEPGSTHLWRMEDVRVVATDACRPTRVEGERACTLHLNAGLSLGASDAARVHDILAKNHEEGREGRSIWIDLEQPIVTYAGKETRPIVQLQIKGVVFDARIAPHTYGGVGWRPEYYFADTDGRFQRYHPGHDALGSCFLSEALREFTYTLRAFPLLHSVIVPLPVGWGEFDGRFFEGEAQGFVVLGLPQHGPRGHAFVEGIQRFDTQAGRDATRAALVRRARAMRAMHDAGHLLPFRHFHNLSETADGVVVMHDLGDRCALDRTQLHGPAQFEAQAFTDLCFAMAPLEHIVLNAPHYALSRTLIHDHLDFFADASIEGYWGDRRPDVSFDGIEQAFRLGFEAPFHEVDHPVAAAWRALATSRGNG